MKRNYLLCLLAFAFTSLGFAQIISQYVETDSGSVPKGIEIWNNTSGIFNFATNNLVILQGTNGGTPTAAITINSGTLAPGNVIVIGTSSGNLNTVTTSNGSAFVIFNFVFNGDDSLVVRYGGVTTDVFGTPGTDPGASWSGGGVSTANHNISLNSGITAGSTGFADPSTRFNTTSSTPSSGVAGVSGFGIPPIVSSNSNEANIVENGFDEPDNINYLLYNAASGLSTINAIKIGEFSLQDSGDTPPDADDLGTTLTALDLTVQNFENIAALALFDGTTNISEMTTVTSTTNFSGLNFEAPDNGTKTFSVYATFNSSVMDNEQIQLTVSSATADTSGSVFAAPDAGGASTSVAGDDNRIDVVATDLIFDTHPTDSFVNTALSPAPTVWIVDINANIDLDYASNIVVNSNGSLTGTSTTSVAPIAGIATFDNLVFFQEGSGIALIATTTTLNPDTSNTFNVNPAPTGATDLFFSEYVEGSSNNKYLEIYNRTGVDVTLSEYSVELYNNGNAGTPNSTEDFSTGFPATLANGETLVLRNSAATIYTGTSYSATVCNFNGDDALVLRRNGTIIDVIGNVGCDPGSEWEDGANSTLNQTIVRNSDVCSGVFNDPNNSPCTFPTLGTEWTSYDIDDVSNLGSHLSNCGVTNEPITYVFNEDMGGWSPEDPSGVSTAQDNVIIDNGSATITEDTTVGTFGVSPGAALTINSGITLTLDDVLSLESSSTEYASLINDGTITGNVVYSRHVNTGAVNGLGGNDLISAPLSGQTFSEFVTANPNIVSDPNNINRKLFGPFNKTTGEYQIYNSVDDAAVTLNNGVGYRAASTDGATFAFTGTPLNENVDVNILNSGPQFEEWNLVGNPYPSYLNVQDFLTHEVAEGVTNIDLMSTSTAGIYGYNANTTNKWTVYNLASDPDLTVTPGQGFFVSADATQVDAHDLQFTPDMRTIDNSDDFIAGRNTTNNTTASLFVKAVSESSETSTEFYFNSSASLGLDKGYDSGVFGNNASSFALYSHLVQDNSGVDMAIQSLAYSDLGTDVTIPLGVNVSQGQQVTISILSSTLPESIEVYLEDNVTNSFTPLNTNDYTFTANSNLTDTGRFFLRFTNTALSTDTPEINGLQIYTDNAKALFIKGQLFNSTNIFIYDIQGRLIRKIALDSNSNSNKVDVSNLSKGVYVVKLNNTTQQKTQKVIIK